MNNKDRALFDKLCINRLAEDATSSFNVSPSTAKKVATKFIKSKVVPLDDPILNHCGIESYTRIMLAKYHVLSKKQLSKQSY